MADYSPLSEASSSHHHNHTAAGEFIDLTIPATLSDSDSVTSPARHKSSSSTSSDSSLSDSLQDSEANKIATTSSLPPPEGTPPVSADKKKVDSPRPSPTLGIDASILEALARLCSFVSSRTLTSDSDQSQAHNDKLGPEATKVKKLMDKIRTYAFNPEFFQMLLDDPGLGPEISDAITQLKGLDISDLARLMITAFENIFIPMLENTDCIRENEQQVEMKGAFVKENLDVVVQANEEITGIMAMIEQKQQELSPKQKRADEIRSRIADLHKEIAVLHEELETVTVQEEEINQLITPAQAQVNKITVDAVAISNVISSVEAEIAVLKAKTEDFESHVVHLQGDLRSFQSKFKHFLSL